MTFWSSSERTGRRIENKVKTVNLNSWKIRQKRVAIVDFGLKERRSNSGTSYVITQVSYGPEIPDIKGA